GEADVVEAYDTAAGLKCNCHAPGAAAPGRDCEGDPFRADVNHNGICDIYEYPGVTVPGSSSSSGSSSSGGVSSSRFGSSSLGASASSSGGQSGISSSGLGRGSSSSGGPAASSSTSSS